MIAVVRPAPPSPPGSSSANIKPAGRWFIALGFLLSSLVTAGLGYVGQRYYFDYQNQQTDLLAKVSAFEKRSEEMPELVSAFNRRLIAGQEAQQQREAVAANAREQYRTLNDALPYVPADKIAVA